MNLLKSAHWAEYLRGGAPQASTSMQQAECGSQLALTLAGLHPRSTLDGAPITVQQPWYWRVAARAAHA
jgi:hypothetical protein